MRVNFTDESKRDLRDVAIFIAGDSPRRAVAFVAELEAACLTLADYPRRFPMIPEYEHLGLRRRPLGSYGIIYLVEDDIRIVRVLHSAMDLSAALGD